MRLRVRDVDVWFEGQGDGRPFVWGHGLLSSRAAERDSGLFAWDAAACGAHLVRYDARSHGLSSATADERAHRWPALARDLLAVVDGLDLGPSVLGGASMGCATALHAAVQRPEAARALVLAIPPTAWETRRAQAELYIAGAGLVERDGMAALAAVAAASPVPAVFAEIEDEVRRRQTEARAEMSAALVVPVLLGAAASDLPAPDAVATITAPTLVLAWEGDAGHPVSTAARLAELLPGAELSVAADLAAVMAWPDLVASFVRSLD